MKIKLSKNNISCEGREETEGPLFLKGVGTGGPKGPKPSTVGRRRGAWCPKLLFEDIIRIFLFL